MMDREKQVEEMAAVINEMDERNAHYYDEYMRECDAFADANAIDKVLYDAGYRKQEWISVDERLPEDGVWVLGYSAKSGSGGLCNCLKSYVREFGNYDDTTHWLPLPEFPKKKGE